MSINGPKNQWIASLCSFILHLVLLILLAIWTIAGSGIGDRFTIFSGTSEPLGEEAQVVEIEPIAPSEATAGVGLDDVSSAPLLTESPVSLDTGELSAPQPQATLADQVRFSGASKELGVGGFLEMSIESRKPQNRQSAAQKFGATPQSEAAVNAALAYLAAHQKNNGSWSMGFDVCQHQCTEPCTDKLDQHEIAATGLALLCFLGAGHTPDSPEYGNTVSQGLYCSGDMQYPLPIDQVEPQIAPYPSTATPAEDATVRYAGKQSFQILAAGDDDLWGGLPSPPYPAGPFPPEHANNRASFAPKGISSGAISR